MQRSKCIILLSGLGVVELLCRLDFFVSRVDVLSIETNSETHTDMYTVVHRDGNEVQVPQEFLRPISDDDVAAIPITIDQVQEHLPKLTTDELTSLLHPSQE